jgi:ElaB/YqjD/DUF883 family membrane-anchored ribosome-binding protein
VGKVKTERNDMTTYEANQKLTGDINLVLRDAEELLKATANGNSENLSEVRSRLASAVESAKATYERIKEKTVKAAQTTDHAIREHPYESIGIACGVGLLLGVLLGRRR